MKKTIKYSIAPEHRPRVAELQKLSDGSPMLLECRSRATRLREFILPCGVPSAEESFWDEFQKELIG